MTDIRDLDANVFLGPFVEVIRSEDTAGPITGVALSSVNKFLSYGLMGKFKHTYLQLLIHHNFMWGTLHNLWFIQGEHYSGKSGHGREVEIHTFL